MSALRIISLNFGYRALVCVCISVLAQEALILTVRHCFQKTLLMHVLCYCLDNLPMIQQFFLSVSILIVEVSLYVEMGDIEKQYCIEKNTSRVNDGRESI